MAKKPMVIRYISRQIVANKTHCSNNCPGMTSAQPMYCNYFGFTLTWDPAHKENGNLRLKACKDRELSLRDEE